ncbi:MAG: 30S ribosomal protein S9 [Candidatus Heimdallarchaeota archaeon]|nr:30S ribosomal protein S9 [Candidatus Heimdallarchaeota archaeon]
MSDIILTSGKRRTAVARARLKQVKGKGVIRVNGVPLELIEPYYARVRIEEPLMLVKKFVSDDLDIKIRVHGGGVSSRAEAARMALARAIDKHLGLNEVREIFEEYDRTMIVGDSRRTEPKKAGGSGARARFQKSYR